MQLPGLWESKKSASYLYLYLYLYLCLYLYLANLCICKQIKEIFYWFAAQLCNWPGGDTRGNLASSFLPINLYFVFFCILQFVFSIWYFVFCIFVYFVFVNIFCESDRLVAQVGSLEAVTSVSPFYHLTLPLPSHPSFGQTELISKPGYSCHKSDSCFSVWHQYQFEILKTGVSWGQSTLCGS